MITDVSFVIRPEDEHNSNFLKFKAAQALSEKGIQTDQKGLTLVFIKKSIDARHGQVKLCMRFKVYIGEKPEDSSLQNALPVWKKTDQKKRVVIIGSGPAGLFGALRLLEDGITPVIIERGAETPERKHDIASISTTGSIDANSNYCFGEGGAGTFSDGKLYTRSNKRGDIGRILRIFAYFGADKSILTDAHPHIGTDRLPAIINAMRAKITELGGEFHFHTQCVGFVTEQSRCIGIKAKNTKTGEEVTFSGSAVLLATGHSATDIYELLANTAPSCLEAKTFAVGVRVEHPRTLIDSIQFHGKSMPQAAEYRLTSQCMSPCGRQDDDNDNSAQRGVYSFCMCPGGFVVPSATAPGQIVINGMSSAARNSKWSNAAIVVETRPEDIPSEYVKKAEEKGCKALAGLLWRTWFEQETAKHGDGQKTPAQRLTDFLEHQDSKNLPDSSYTPGIVASRIDEWLPKQISIPLAQGFKEFDKGMKGFVCSDALLIASETRTSTPVRVTRDEATYECKSLPGIYPAGEGSGYSGGIVSSAMDGENVCEAICKIMC
jgi:uncharacterized protein